MSKQSRKKTTRPTIESSSPSSDSGIIELWCLRMLVQHGGHRKFVTKDEGVRIFV